MPQRTLTSWSLKTLCRSCRLQRVGSFQLHDRLREDSQVYSKVVNYAAQDRNIKVVIKVDCRGNRRVLCSTDLSLSAEEILNLYEARFQIRFNEVDSL